jgi:hypothetical protein
MLAPENNPQGECLEGYNGILCADCVPGYSRTGTFECSLCPDLTSNIIKLVAVTLIVIGGVCFIIRSTIQGAKDKYNITSIYMKILMNHFQLIVMTASFNFKWPEQVL